MMSHADISKPTITLVSFVSDAPTTNFAGTDSKLTLTFTVADNNDLPSATSGWAPVVTIDSQSATPGTITGGAKSKTFVYTYIVPSGKVSGNLIGYTVDADDAGNNDATRLAPAGDGDKITVGT